MIHAALVCALLAVGAGAQQLQPGPPPHLQQGPPPQLQQRLPPPPPPADPDLPVQSGKQVTRILGADQLRDFQGLCFGSTTFRFYVEDTTWDLEVFCGKSTCMKNATGLYEKVEDCGPQPKPNKDCWQIAKPEQPQQQQVPRTSAFPACCPVYQCKEGVKLEFPTAEEIKLKAEKARSALEATLHQAPGNQKDAVPSPQPATAA